MSIKVTTWEEEAGSMAAEDVLPSAKRRKYSKNKKKNWRKFTNVKDVDEFLDETRREERTGGVAAEKEDGDLYFEEKDPTTTEEPVTRKKKPLRSESNLYSNMTIRPISVPLRRKYKRLKEKEIGMEGDTSSEEEYDNRSFREKLKQQWKLKSTIQRRKYKKMKEEISERELKDLWIGDDHEEQGDDFYLTVTCKKHVKKPRLLGKRPSALQCVEPPHPGASYNPTFVDHQELLGKAVKVEEAQVAALQALDKRVQLAEMDHKERKQVWVTEMSEGLPKPPGSGEDDSEVNDEENDEAMDCPLLKRPVRAEDRKTRKQRRKARELKEADHLRKSQKQDKLTMSEVYRIKSIKKDLRRKEEDSKIKMIRKEHLKQLDPYRTKRLGKQPFEEPEIAVKLSTELIGSLRAMKPEGSLLVDRYKSLQKRNMIVPKGPRASAKERKRNQPKVKVVEKRSIEPVAMKT